MAPPPPGGRARGAAEELNRVQLGRRVMCAPSEDGRCGAAKVGRRRSSASGSCEAALQV